MDRREESRARQTVQLNLGKWGSAAAMLYDSTCRHTAKSMRRRSRYVRLRCSARRTYATAETTHKQWNRVKYAIARHVRPTHPPICGAFFNNTNIQYIYSVKRTKMKASCYRITPAFHVPQVTSPYEKSTIATSQKFDSSNQYNSPILKASSYHVSQNCMTSKLTSP